MVCRGDKTPKELSWSTGVTTPNTVYRSSQVHYLQRMLTNYRDNLLLVEERMSEYVLFNEIPLQLIKNKRQVEEKVRELEAQLKEGGKL